MYVFGGECVCGWLSERVGGLAVCWWEVFGYLVFVAFYLLLFVLNKS